LEISCVDIGGKSERYWRGIFCTSEAGQLRFSENIFLVGGLGAESVRCETAALEYLGIPAL
jgi:hypothetical protein